MDTDGHHGGFGSLCKMGVGGKASRVLPGSARRLVVMIKRCCRSGDRMSTGGTSDDNQ